MEKPQTKLCVRKENENENEPLNRFHAEHLLVIEDEATMLPMGFLKDLRKDNN